VTEAFDAADTYYYRSMARAQRLRDARATCNGDLSARELDQTCGSVEHLLYVLRRQRRSVAAADAAERRFARCVRALDAVKRDVLSSFKNEDTRSFFVLPRQASTFAWLLRQRNSLDTLLSAAKAARLVHKAVANAETVPELRPGGVATGAAAALKEVEAEVAKARASLDAHVAPSLACDAVFDESKDTSLPNDLSKTSSETSSEERAWRVSACALATGELHATLHANFATIKRAREIVEGVFVSAAEANRACHAPNGSGDDASFAPLPGWEPLRALLREGARDAEAYADAEKEQGRLVDETQSETEKALTASASTEASRAAVAAAAARFAAAAEAGVGAALVWAQTAKRASEDELDSSDAHISRDGRDDPSAKEKEEEKEKEKETPTIDGAEQTLNAAMSPARLVAVARRVEAMCSALAELTDCAHGSHGPLDDVSRGVVAAASARAAELAPLLTLVGVAFRRAFASYLRFHRASAKLEAVLSSVAVGLCLEGFCASAEEAEGGEGDDGREDDGRRRRHGHGRGRGQEGRLRRDRGRGADSRPGGHGEARRRRSRRDEEKRRRRGHRDAERFRGGRARLVRRRRSR
jgi:hypothetical protein